jgi:hypothetical protein
MGLLTQLNGSAMTLKTNYKLNFRKKAVMVKPYLVIVTPSTRL